MSSSICDEHGRSSYPGQDERGVAGLEFAIVAPIMLLLIWGVWDVARALIAWEETYHAAEAVAQAAEKMSITSYTDSATGRAVTALTAQKMQSAMSSIYAEMPWLSLGGDPALFPGNYSVTLSGVSWNPLCVASPTNTCLLQQPVLLWSTYLSEAAPQVQQGPRLLKLLRSCTAPLKSVQQFPNDTTQLTSMIPLASMANAQNMILIPQVVADVQYVFSPSFPLLSGFTYTFWASATFPAPLGGDDQTILYDTTQGTGPFVQPCPGGSYNG